MHPQLEAEWTAGSAATVELGAPPSRAGPQGFTLAAEPGAAYGRPVPSRSVRRLTPSRHQGDRAAVHVGRPLRLNVQGSSTFVDNRG